MDVKSIEVMLHEELAKLRGAVDGTSAVGNSIAAAPAGTNLGSSEQTAKIKSLEREIKELKEAADASTKEIAKLKSAGSAMVSNESNTTATLTIKEQEIKKLRDSEATFKNASVDKDKTISKQNLELEKLKADLSSTKNALDALQKTHDKAVVDAEARLESEKEEIMEAMAQEVDELEKSKADELAAEKVDTPHPRYNFISFITPPLPYPHPTQTLGAKHEKVSAHLRKAITGQTSSIRALKEQCSIVKKEQKSMVMVARKEIDDMRDLMKTYYTR